MPVTGNNHIHYILSIRVTAGGFSFFVTEGFSSDMIYRDTTTCRSHAEMLFMISEKLQGEKIKSREYDSIRVIVDAESTTLPASEYDEEKNKDVYRLIYSQTQLDDKHMCCVELPEINAVELFPIDEQLYDAITTIYPEAAFTNTFASVMERITHFSMLRDPEEQPLYAHINDGELFLYSIFKNKLIYANHFHLDDADNAPFFLLSVWKMLELDAHKNFCFISGKKQLASTLMNQATPFLENVEIIKYGLDV